MKIRNYLMYWANRMFAPDFKNQYYQANLKQFWDHTYEEMCISIIISMVVSLSLFPWGINWSENHPLYHAGWGFACAQFILSSLIFFSCIVGAKHVLTKSDSEKFERSAWLFVLAFLSALVMQHGFTKTLYKTIPSPMVASLFPLSFFLISGIVIKKLSISTLDKIDVVKDKILSGISFLFLDPKTQCFRLTLLLEKIFGKRPEKPSPHNTLIAPKPKDYKIWGVKSNAEKELQKILDE